MALGTSAWCGAATSFNSYMAARILNGFFSTVAQAVSIRLGVLQKHILIPVTQGGLMFIQDIFFFHEHP